MVTFSSFLLQHCMFALLFSQTSAACTLSDVLSSFAAPVCKVVGGWEPLIHGLVLLYIYIVLKRHSLYLNKHFTFHFNLHFVDANHMCVIFFLRQLFGLDCGGEVAV